MLVTMLSQTLYLLVDLYWVGSLGKEAVAAVGLAGNLSFVVLALHAGPRRRHDHADRPCLRRARPRAGPRGVPPVAVAVARCRGACSSSSPGRAAASTSTAFAADAATARLGDGYLRWFVPALALQFVLATMAAALRGTGAFKAPMLVQVDDRRHQHRAGADPDLRLGHRRRDRRVRRGHRLARGGRGRHRLAVACSSSPQDAFLRFRAAEAGPRPGGCGGRSSRSACRPAPSSA